MNQSVSPCPVLAFTVACGAAAREDARLCEASFRYWHPDVPFLVIDDERYRLLSGGYAPAWVGEIVSMRSLAGWFLSRHAARLVYLDADTFVLGRLDELLDPAAGTLWTADRDIFTMGVPECPRVNSGVVASSDPALWLAWTSAQYGYLVPAVSHCYFDQLTLRLLILAGAVQGRMIDGRPGLPYYNVAIGEQRGEWRVENGAVFKGAERALIFHCAGHKERGIASTPPGIQSRLTEITTPPSVAVPHAPGVALANWWEADGTAFSSTVKEQFAQWATGTLEELVPDAYAATPGHYRTVAPLAYDRQRNTEGTPWGRIWKQDWQCYVYFKRRAAS